MIKPSPNPFFADEILIINSRRMDTFMKKLSKYEDLKGKEWQLDDWSFNCVAGIAEELRCWIQDYLKDTNSVMLFTRGKTQ